MMTNQGVYLVEADQCMFGLKTWGTSKSQLVLAKKPTRFMTTSQVLGRELSRRCDGSHEHQPLLDGRAKDAARYPPGLCRAICRGIAKEKMLIEYGLSPMCSVGEERYTNYVDLEAEHEREEPPAWMDVDALIKQIEAREALGQQATRGEKAGISNEPVL